MKLKRARPDDSGGPEGPGPDVVPIQVHRLLFAGAVFGGLGGLGMTVGLVGVLGVIPAPPGVRMVCLVPSLVCLGILGYSRALIRGGLRTWWLPRQRCRSCGLEMTPAGRGPGRAATVFFRFRCPGCDLVHTLTRDL